MKVVELLMSENFSHAQSYEDFQSRLKGGALDRSADLETRMVNSEEIAPLSISDPGRDEKSKDFWHHHNDSESDYKEFARAYPKIREEMQNGRSLSELKTDPSLGKATNFWFGKPITLNHYRGSYFLDDGGRHRVALAHQYHLGEIPARVCEWSDKPKLEAVKNSIVANTPEKGRNKSGVRTPPISRSVPINRDAALDQPRTKSGLRPPPRASSVQHKPNDIEQPRTKSGLRPPPASRATAPRDHGQSEQPKTKSGLKSPPPSHAQSKHAASNSEQPKTKAGLRPPPPSKPVSDHARSAAEPQKAKSGLRMPPPPPPPPPTTDRAKGRGR